MNDLISRQAAIDAMERKMDDTINRQSAIDAIRGEIEINGYSHVVDVLEQLPSAQQDLCEDAVSRRRLLSDLKELIAAWEKYPVMAEQIKGVEAAIGYVQLIPSAQPEQRWIPCSERLPEELGDYLVSIKRIGWNCEEYVENDIAYWDHQFHKADKVIAWMPLPEPYREEGE